MIQSNDPRREELTTLGLLGLAPFALGALALWLSPLLLPQFIATNVFKLSFTYAGVIAGYMAGMGAGALLLTGKPTEERFLPGMIAALMACFTILPSFSVVIDLDYFWRIGLLILVFVYLLMRDLRAVKAGGMPIWYGNLRMRLTFWACLLLAVMAVRLLFWGFY